MFYNIKSVNRIDREESRLGYPQKVQACVDRLRKKDMVKFYFRLDTCVLLGKSIFAQDLITVFETKMCLGHIPYE